jgi:hypothetical protein
MGKVEISFPRNNQGQRETDVYFNQKSIFIEILKIGSNS